MDGFVEEQQRQHVWEGAAERSWEDLVEDPAGRLVQRKPARRSRPDSENSENSDEEEEAPTSHHRHLKEEDAATVGGRRWMLRSAYLCIDASQASAHTDFKPSRLRCAVEAAKAFTVAFFDENPLSTLGVLCVRRGKVDKLCALSKHAPPVLSALDSLQHCEGAFSLQNVLDVARQLFEGGEAALHASREVVLVCSAVNVLDAGDVYVSLQQQLPKNVRVSAVHLAAQLEVVRRVCRETRGVFRVATSAASLRELLLRDHLSPPQSTSAAVSHIVRMGFPAQTLKDSTSSLTSHAQQPQPSFVGERVAANPFYCPNCQCAADAIPATCRCCALQLVSSSHLARSFHHLFPIPAFLEQRVDCGAACLGCGAGGSAIITSSSSTAPNKKQRRRRECPKCHNLFCRACDELIHDTLFACPGCC